MAVDETPFAQTAVLVAGYPCLYFSKGCSPEAFSVSPPVFSNLFS